MSTTVIRTILTYNPSNFSINSCVGDFSSFADWIITIVVSKSVSLAYFVTTIVIDPLRATVPANTSSFLIFVIGMDSPVIALSSTELEPFTMKRSEERRVGKECRDRWGMSERKKER